MLDPLAFTHFVYRGLKVMNEEFLALKPPLLQPHPLSLLSKTFFFIIDTLEILASYP